MARYCHTVDSDDVDLDAAIRDGKLVTASCGVRWVPVAAGKQASAYPDCPDCKSGRSETDPKANRPHYVYRCYDADDRLIYVGCTVAPVNRMTTHKVASWWFEQTVRIRYVVFPTRQYALRMERQAIANERPRWNVKGRWPNRALWEEGDYADYWFAATQAAATPITAHTQKHLSHVAAEAKRRYGIDLEEIAA